MRDATLSRRAQLRAECRRLIRDLVHLGYRREELAGVDFLGLVRLKAAALDQLMRAPQGTKGRP